MLLLRSWRGYEVVDFLAHVFAGCGARAAADEAWAVVHAEYLRWRDGVAEVGRPFFTRGGGPVPEPPVFGSAIWWACVVFRQMRYFDIGLMRLKHTVNSLPLDLVSLPQEVTPAGASADPEIELDGGEHGLLVDAGEGEELLVEGAVVVVFAVFFEKGGAALV